MFLLEYSGSVNATPFTETVGLLANVVLFLVAFALNLLSCTVLFANCFSEPNHHNHVQHSLVLLVFYLDQTLHFSNLF